MPFTLQNICRIAAQALKMIQEFEKKDVLISLGDTGCGKTTLLNALLFGPESLEVRQLEGVRRRVIEVKEGGPGAAGGFRIGHS